MLNECILYPDVNLMIIIVVPSTEHNEDVKQSIYFSMNQSTIRST